MCTDPIIQFSDGTGFGYPYGIMIAVGILACFAVLYGYGHYFKISTKLLDFTFYTAIGAIAVGFGFASLWQSLYNFIENPDRGFRFGTSITVIPGLVFGTAFFLGIYFLFYRPRSQERILHLLPIVPCCFLIAHAFGRVGCFLGGCCYGRETDNSFFGVQLPGDDHLTLPTNLWEAIFLFILFGVCTYLIFRHNYRLTCPLYTFSYGIFRFINEFFRADHRGDFIPGITPSQFWCILIVIASVPFYILLKRAYEKLDREKETTQKA